MERHKVGPGSSYKWGELTPINGLIIQWDSLIAPDFFEVITVITPFITLNSRGPTLKGFINLTFSLRSWEPKGTPPMPPPPGNKALIRPN